jgi:hypothetical protein
MKTLQQQIKYYADQFEVKTRTNGETYVCAPEADDQLQHALYEAQLPDDWTYSTFNAILERMQDYDTQTLEDFEGDYQSEIVDSLVDISTHDLTGWLHSHNSNVYYLTEVQEQYGAIEDGFNLLSMAQYMAIDEIYTKVYQLLESTEGEAWE